MGLHLQKAAFYSKVNNEKVLNVASEIAYGEPDKIKLASRIISDRAITLLGHIIRADDNDQMKKVAIDAEFKRVERNKRRVGRPRFFWLQLTMERAYRSYTKKENLTDSEFVFKNAEQRALIAKLALERNYPFHKDKKMSKKKKK